MNNNQPSQTLTCADFLPGDVFRLIGVKHFEKLVFTVKKIQNGLVICQDERKVFQSFGGNDLQFYAGQFEFINRPNLAQCETSK